MATQKDYCDAGFHSYNYHNGYWRKCCHCNALWNARTNETIRIARKEAH